MLRAAAGPSLPTITARHKTAPARLGDVPQGRSNQPVCGADPEPHDEPLERAQPALAVLRRRTAPFLVLGGQVYARLLDQLAGYLGRDATRGPASNDHIAVRDGVERHRTYGPGAAPTSASRSMRTSFLACRLPASKRGPAGRDTWQGRDQTGTLAYPRCAPSRSRRRSRCGITVYLGSREDGKPAS